MSDKLKATLLAIITFIGIIVLVFIPVLVEEIVYVYMIGGCFWFIYSSYKFYYDKIQRNKGK